MIAGLRNGKYEPVAGVEESISTHETTRTISSDGERIEEMHIKGLMKLTGNEDLALGFTINQYGEPILQELRWDPVNGDYSFGTEIETNRTYPRTIEVENFTNMGTNKYVDDEAGIYEKIENEEGENADLTISDIYNKEKTLEEDEEDSEYGRPRKRPKG